MKAYILVAIASLYVSGCATIVRGSNQQVSVNSEPDGAEVEFSDGQSCTTPCVAEVKRKRSLQLTIKKDGCLTTTRSMVPTLAGEGAILGGLIDYGTGAVYNLEPNPLFVRLNCEYLNNSEPAEANK